MRELLDRLERHSDRMTTVLMVREPSSTDAADAYEGLRKQVVAAFAERRSHLAQLVQLDDALGRGADPRALAAMVTEWLEQASLQRVVDFTDPRYQQLFEVLGEPGGAMEVVTPAYVDELTGRPVRVGRVQRARPAEPVPVGVASDRGPADGRHSIGEEQA
jgi:hypothetical protein